MSLRAVLVAATIAAFCTPLSAREFYVSPRGSDSGAGTAAAPFATLERARDAIRQLKGQGPLSEPVTVLLTDGLHLRQQPLVLSPEDSGTEACPVTYTAAPGAKAILSGGRRITGWKQQPNGTWTVEIPEAQKGKWHFRQLYVNEKLCTRARTPNEGFFRVAGFPEGTPKTVNYHTDCQSFEYAPGDLDPNWANLDDVEVIVYHFWTDSHLPIRSIDTGKRVVTFKHKAGKVFTDDFTTDGARYIVENVREGLDQPGEWYLDRKTGVVTYRPRPGEDMATAEVIAPVAPALVRLEGRPAERQPVEHIHFANLSLMYTHFELPPGNSNDPQGSASVPAAVVLAGARDCSFERCAIRNLGTSAIEVSAGSSGNRFLQNEISFVAACGFRVDGASAGGSPLLRTRGNTISDNAIHHYGDVYPSAVGILLMNTSENLVEHNDIHHGWYTGVSIGWSWGYQRSAAFGNRVEQNHIHTIGQGLLSDMGAVYTLGVSPGTTIRNNLIHQVEANQYGGWGIYNDEGSTHILIENNVVYNTKFAGYNIHYAKELTVRNNIFALGRLEQLSRGRVEPHHSVYFENNIVYWKEGELFSKNWKDKPYQFHFNPTSDRGTREVTSTFEADWNLYFNPTLAPDKVTFNGRSLAQWREEGRDRHSVIADPKFVDAEHFDFRLQPDSPALALGFQPIDLSAVGPRR
ncbi:MAG: right-handed parallel beta-helix repeat-containing protein [Thermoguttaceae bacterium]